MPQWELEEDEGVFYIETTSNWVGCKVVRFAPDSEIAWKNINGEESPDVTIWNQTDDIEIWGVSGEVSYYLLG